MEKQYAIEMHGIDMSFFGVQVLHNVDFKLKPGEIKGLVGKNGAGKSTLLKIVQGIFMPTNGTIKILEKDISHNTSIQERTNNIGMIYQEFSLVPEMTVVQNIFLNDEITKNYIIDEKISKKKVEELFGKYNININPNARIIDLNTSDMQMVEICKSVIRNKKILLMDEPTAALESEQVQKLFDIIRALKADGISIVFISHHLKEVMHICDSVDVLRDGKMVMSELVCNITIEEMISAMLGEVNIEFGQHRTITKIKDTVPILELHNVTSNSIKNPLSLKLYPGEVLGIAGLKGSGRTELFNIIYGIDPINSGEIFLSGKPIKINHPKKAVENGIFLVPENRQTLGLILEHSLYRNMHIPWLKNLKKYNYFVDDNKGRSVVSGFIKSLQLKCNSIRDVVKNLSGGNQQKVVIGKALGLDPKIILMDDPTYGVDVHAKVEIMMIIDRFKINGGSVILVSSEIEEIVNNCDRIIVLKNCTITDEISNMPPDFVTQESLVAAIQ